MKTPKGRSAVGVVALLILIGVLWSATFASGTENELLKGPAKFVQEAYCPMADANWLQKEDAIINPYFGKKMLNCGEFDRHF